MSRPVRHEELDASAQLKIKRKKKQRIIPPERRKKVAQACDSCKKRKQKCNGVQPCGLCISRQFVCEYTFIDRRILKPSKRELEERRRAAETSAGATSISSNGNMPHGDATTLSTKEEQHQKMHIPNPHQYSISSQSSYGAPNVLLVQYSQQGIPQQPPPPPMYLQTPHPLPFQQMNHPMNHPINQQPHQQQVGHIPQQIQDFNTQSQYCPQNFNNSHSYLQGNGSLVTLPATQQQQQHANKEPHTYLQQHSNPQPLHQQQSSPSGENQSESFKEAIKTIERGNSITRVLFDELGNLSFIGECSPSSYIIQCQKVFSKSLGPNEFSDDPDRYVLAEAPLLNRMNQPSQPSLPAKDYADYLLRTYFNNSNIIVYILDDSDLKAKLNQVYLDPSNASANDICILTLVFAIASVYAKVEVASNLFPFPPQRFIDPQTFHEFAVSTLNRTEEDGNLWLVEAHLLLFFFHQFTGRRNTAWIRLGSAIRYAQALGMNRKYVNESFKDSSYVLHRRKLFRSLYIMDRMTSLYMGRSLTINDNDWDDRASFNSFQDFPNKLLKICELIGKVLSTIYFNPSISLKAVLTLADEFKAYSVNHPLNPVTPENYARHVDHKHFLPHIVHLHGLMLLSRPFFHVVVLQKLELIKFDKNSKNMIHLNNFYRSCVNSSLMIIRIVHYAYFQNVHPFKPLGLISCVFHAGLIVGLLLLLRFKGIKEDIFENTQHVNPDENLDEDSLLLQAMKSAITLLDSYGEIDVPSKRYAKILRKMLEVTTAEPSSANPDGVKNNSASASSSFSQVGSNSISTPIDIAPNHQDSYQNILRFQDWLFPRFESSAVEEPPAHQNNETLLQHIAGLNNFNSSDAQFLDDFLYRVIDNQTVNKTNNYSKGAIAVQNSGQW